MESGKLVEKMLYAEHGLYIHGGAFAGVHRMACHNSLKIHGGIGTIFTPCFAS